MPELVPITEKPLIAISGKVERYAEWVLRGGGVYQLAEQRADCQLDKASGLLLTGGEDVDPALYGELNRCSRVNPERDKFELRLLQIALCRDMPVLAVCRGMQLLVVALGGKLYQDLSERVSDAAHRECVSHRGPEHTDTAHSVDVHAQTSLAKAVGQKRLLVNSHHHQGIRDLPADLRVSAVAPDGLIEAVEHKGKTCVLGVQWHPERWPDKSSDAIMKQFLVGCESYRSACLS